MELEYELHDYDFELIMDKRKYMHTITEDDDKIGCCLVCMVNEEKGDNSFKWHRYKLKCSHQLHTRCARKWFNKKNKINCPYCGDLN